MSLVQIPVRVKASTPGGVALEGARIVSTITKMEVDGGILVRQPIVGVTNASGYVDLAHWPNTRGLNGSRYKVQIWFNEAVIDGFFMTVPEANSGSWPVLAEAIINQAPYPAVDAAQAAVITAQAAAVEAAGNAQQTAADCNQAGVYAAEAADSAAAAAQSAIDAGNASRLEAGAVTALNPGEAATAWITGAPGAQVLHLGIPKGDKGDTGPSGAGERRHAFAAPYSYAGVAIAGTLDGASGWTITRIAVAANGTTTVATATGAWSDRETLTYT